MGNVRTTPLHWIWIYWIEDISKFTPDFIINYDFNSNPGYKLIVDFDYGVYLQPLQRGKLVLLEKGVINGISKLACTFYEEKTIIHVTLDYESKL